MSLVNSTKVTQAQKDELLAGAPFDANGNSTAKVHYTVFEINSGTWLYNFNLFYSCVGVVAL